MSSPSPAPRHNSAFAALHTAFSWHSDFQTLVKPVSCFYATLAKWSKRRAPLARELRARNLRVLMPVYRVKTPWNSHYDALRRFVNIKPALDAVPLDVLGISQSSDGYDLAAQSDATFAAAPYVPETLEPFVRWTTVLSAASSVTISLVPCAVNELLALAESPMTMGGSRARVANELPAQSSRTSYDVSSRMCWNPRSIQPCRLST
jgi:hypothetical protein